MKNTVWKTLSQKVLLKHPRLTVCEDEVELPNGHKTSYVYIDEVPGAVMVIVQRQDRKILLQREYSYPPNKWLYQFPGGAIEKGEKRTQAAERELAEEASLSGTLEEVGSFYVNNRRMKHKFYVYLAINLGSTQAEGDIEEDIESYWFSEQEIDAMIKNGEIENYSVLAGWALYKARLNA